MIGFQQIIPIAVVLVLALILGPVAWKRLMRGIVRGAKDVRELGKELSTISNNDTEKKDKIKIKK